MFGLVVCRSHVGRLRTVYFLSLRFLLGAFLRHLAVPQILGDRNEGKFVIFLPEYLFWLHYRAIYQYIIIWIIIQTKSQGTVPPTSSLSAATTPSTPSAKPKEPILSLSERYFSWYWRKWHNRLMKWYYRMVQMTWQLLSKESKFKNHCIWWK